MWSAVEQWLPGTGLAGLLLIVGFKLHTDAIRAERRVSAAWRAIADERAVTAQIERDRADELQRQMAIMMRPP